MGAQLTLLHRAGQVAGRLRVGNLALGLLVGLSLPLAGCGSSASKGSASQSASKPAAATSSTSASAGSSRVSYDGPTLQTPAIAPPIALRNYLGQSVDTTSYRGKALLVTFLYTHCPDTCPLITANLHNALRLLGPRASMVRIVAVSTDPKGDTRRTVAAFLAKHEMTGRMEYLIGNRATLTPVWRAWGVSVSNPTSQDEVNHSALVYGITGSGKVTVVYPSNFTPMDIAHDVPRLADH